MQIHARDDPHVPLPPFAAAELDLLFEEFEDGEAELGLGDLEVFSEDGAGFVLDQEEGAVGVGFGDFLDEGEERGGGVEEAGGVGCDGGGGERGGGIAEFIDGGFGWGVGG